MAIGMVEMQGMINRTQDFQQLQHFENEKGALQPQRRAADYEGRRRRNRSSRQHPQPG